MLPSAGSQISGSLPATRNVRSTRPPPAGRAPPGSTAASSRRPPFVAGLRATARRSPNRELRRVVGRPNEIKNRLFELRAQEADLAAHYPDTDRGLIDLRDKIRQTEEQLNREGESLTEVTQGLDTHYQALQLDLTTELAQLEALKARQTTLDRQLEVRKATLLELSSHEMNLKGLQREIDIANSEYQ